MESRGLTTGKDKESRVSDGMLILTELTKKQKDILAYPDQVSLA